MVNGIIDSVWWVLNDKGTKIAVLYHILSVKYTELCISYGLNGHVWIKLGKISPVVVIESALHN